MMGEPELGKGVEGLTAPEATVLLHEVESDQDVVSDAKALNLDSGERLGGHGRAELLVGGEIGRGAHVARKERRQRKCRI